MDRVTAAVDPRNSTGIRRGPPPQPLAGSSVERSDSFTRRAVAQRRTGRSPVETDAQRSDTSPRGCGGVPTSKLQVEHGAPPGLHRCALMRVEQDPPLRVDVTASKTLGRKRRLGRGVDRWTRDVSTSWRAPGARRVPAAGGDKSPGPKIRKPGEVALILLTNQPTLESAYGAARNFWKRCRDRWGELTYFCWMELTREGLPHYHAILVNPPRGWWSREVKADLEQYWGNRFVKCKRRDAAWFSRAAGAYVGSYAKKFGTKDYQQDYDDVPRELRTFMCNRLEHPVAELEQHEDHWKGRYVPETYSRETQMVDPPHLELDTRVKHVGGPCTLRYVTKSASLARRRQRSEAAAASRRSARQRDSLFLSTTKHGSHIQDVSNPLPTSHTEADLIIHPGYRADCPECSNLGMDIPKSGLTSTRWCR